jgi:hypothetical protein
MEIIWCWRAWCINGHGATKPAWRARSSRTCTVMSPAARWTLVAELWALVNSLMYWMFVGLSSFL